MSRPLEGIRVLEMGEGATAQTGRILVNLGADVVKVERPDEAQKAVPQPATAAALALQLADAGKRSVALDVDTDQGRAVLLRLLPDTDILLAPDVPGALEARALGPDVLLHTAPQLVVVAVTPFGQDGPYRDWAATDAVLAALGGVLSRSGVPDRPPLLPPEGLLTGTVAVHAAWAALVAYWSRLQTGQGHVVDVSALEAVVHGVDPGFGTQGSAAAGRAVTFPRGRPDARAFYPVLRCRDGHVRICLLAKRQWQAMFSWLGSPAEFADAQYDSIAARFAAADRLHPLIEELFVRHSREELVAEATRRGVPVAGVNTPYEVLDVPHFLQTGALVDREVTQGRWLRVPAGAIRIDGERMGLHEAAPQAGEHRASPDDAVAAPTEPVPAASGLPLQGLRVLDLGVIVFGAELGRAFADQGAEVIKVENSAFPDGLRQSRRGSGMSVSFAWGQRNKRSIGVNLRSPEGRALFLDLVAVSDVVLANFKPGTLEQLGLGYDDLQKVNPRIVLSDSSAFGSDGPWSSRMGYGPLVRASCGITELWRDAREEDAWCDGSTVYPDHVAGLTAAVALIAVLVRRERSGRGGAVQIAQADVALGHLARHLLEAQLSAPDPCPAWSAVVACEGDDEWLAVSVRDEADAGRLSRVVGSDADEASHLLKHLARWAVTQPPRRAMQALQEAGVPAGAMLRLPDQLEDPQLVARRTFAELVHPDLPEPLPTVARAAVCNTLPDAPLRPAPALGEHTREVCREVLGVPESRIEELVRAGILQPAQTSS